MAKQNDFNEEEPLENKDNINNESDDTFGLPEVEYEPLKRDTQSEFEEERVEEPLNEEQSVSSPIETESEVHEEVVERTEEHHHTVEGHHTDYAVFMEPERPSVWPKVIGALLVLFLIGGGLYYYLQVYKPQRERMIAEQNAKDAKERADAERKRQEELAELKRREAEQRRLDSLANLPKEGTIEMLSSRTGQYFIVIASAIDDDLLMDYAQKLVKQGKQVRIIPPFGKKGKFHRLAIDGKDTYEDAQATADALKGGEYGDELWVVRY